MKNDNKKQPNVIKASLKLQQKVGSGPLEEKAVLPAQKVIDTNQVDFEPLGLSILKKLEDALVLSADPSIPMPKVKALLTAPVMELKANAAIFKYPLIGNLANIMLHFLEALIVMDKDAVEIVRAHHKTLHMIVVRKMSGDGGDAGKHLSTELQSVCDRYYHKKFGK
jgi:hypothetical protein